ncbi:tRNA (uridine(54)-C5)-methyltransferase TrmA [Glaciecola sp. 1036]|uniref:tRNA (uridine(54)-C5)-methyltransferase TrmA n=1 Tax=Alteromonadaceae TaxID=72275 RepID=UPI003D004CAA
MADLKQEYKQQLDEKQNRLIALLSPYYQDNVDCFVSPPQHYRMRAEFRIWHQDDETFHIMFEKETKQKYRVDQFPIACKLINQAMQLLMNEVNVNQTLRNKLYQVDYLATTTGQIVISMIYRRPLDDNWQQEATILKQKLSEHFPTDIIGRAKKQKITLDKDFVIEELQFKQETFSFKQIENSFTQPNALINVNMVEWAIDNIAADSIDLLELYCGAGNFSIPLSRYFRKVLGTEISKTSVAAAQFNINANNIDNLNIARLSSEEFVEAYQQKRAFNRLSEISLSEYNFTTILVDPPRAGLDPDTLKLVSQFTHIIYISCNPETLANNLAVLNETHQVSRAALFDQFPFTPHIESGVVLKKRL